MAVVRGPLFSVEAHGDLCGILTYRKGRGNPAVYGHHEPKVPNTAGQVSQQTSFTSAVSSWRALPGMSKVWWGEKARGMRLTGYNMYVQNYLLGLLEG